MCTNRPRTYQSFYGRDLQRYTISWWICFQDSTTRPLLFVSLLAPYPEYLEQTNHIEDSVHYPSDQPIRDFAMIVDSSPKQGQEPFMFVELLDADYPHPDPKKIGKYFRNLDHFITTFLNN